ncbi:TIM23 complex component [Lithohypha guttulata]|uniref:Presequence translocated-associated motor subunit PAM17 n=1 Tax=Lithohypha guttulata TaxID=1690604 RepID=A0ABR0KDY8_9EURO|nr:TIM23 complex component [Lithohypha guttulata]
MSLATFRIAAESIKATAHPPGAPVLNWNSFFSLRTSRRRYSLASSIVSSIAVTGVAFVFLSTQPEMADEVTKLIPMDPVISMGILTFAATFLGWLIGPIFGNTVWKLFHRSRLPEFTVKEKAFFERIRNHRVNPMGASTNNPVPDYYGEKIGSVQGYRRWLRDQRAFNRKREGSYPSGI